MDDTALKSRSPARPATFLQEVIAATPGGDPRLDRCIQCGTCGGSCPSAADMDHTPRQLFALIFAG
ncbi:MAG: 4Fe-4S dicluster domain-containing protein, partial [Caldilineales bacterium]|nr:4Fe-4S dicluster domain-containing protein [Caldilineales bacterium]